MRGLRPNVVTGAIAGFAASMVAALLSSTAEATSPDAASVRFNQHMIEQAVAESDLDIDDIDAVFDHVFARLEDRVTVYPTENYYYFEFLHEGVAYAGNFRLDAADRDRGVIHFAYFNQDNILGREETFHYRAFTQEHGVSVSRRGELEYAVTRGGRTVSFRLNDLRDVEPPAGMLQPGERYLGPIQDESGVRFFFLWNETLAMFLYILDESHKAEPLFGSGVSEQVSIGLRTGFAYYQDRYVDRKILVGVLEHESDVNSYYDGPFDQLPDNFVEGDALRRAFLALDPTAKGDLDRWGNSRALDGRMLADPFILYAAEEELAIFDECAAGAAEPEGYYPCFAIGQTKGTDLR